MGGKVITVCLGVGLLLLPFEQAMAQTTNVVMDAYFVLSGLTQSPSGRVIGVRILSKDILAVLNATGTFNFSPAAKLLFRSTDDNVPVMVVRDTNNGQETTTELGNYFGLSDIGSEVHTPDHLLGWGVWAFAFDDGKGTDFHLWGLNTLRRRTLAAAGVGQLTRAYQVVVPVSGHGDVGATNTVFYGTVYAVNGRVEVK